MMTVWHHSIANIPAYQCSKSDRLHRVSKLVQVLHSVKMGGGLQMLCILTIMPAYSSFSTNRSWSHTNSSWRRTTENSGFWNSFNVVWNNGKEVKLNYFVHKIACVENHIFSIGIDSCIRTGDVTTPMIQALKAELWVLQRCWSIALITVVL